MLINMKFIFSNHTVAAVALIFLSIHMVLCIGGGDESFAPFQDVDGDAGSSRKIYRFSSKRKAVAAAAAAAAASSTDPVVMSAVLMECPRDNDKEHLQRLCEDKISINIRMQSHDRTVSYYCCISYNCCCVQFVNEKKNRNLIFSFSAFVACALYRVMRLKNICFWMKYTIHSRSVKQN